MQYWIEFLGDEHLFAMMAKPNFRLSNQPSMPLPADYAPAVPHTKH
jgi:hypothetical protein